MIAELIRQIPDHYRIHSDLTVIHLGCILQLVREILFPCLIVYVVEDMPTHAVDDCEEKYDPHDDGLFGTISPETRLVVILRELELLKGELWVLIVRSQCEGRHEEGHADHRYYKQWMRVIRYVY